MGTKLYVGNLPYSADEAALRELFAQTGKEVEEVAIVTDRVTGRARGFAFVTMTSDEDAAAAAQQLNGTDLGGRNLVVNEARPREPRMGGGRPGGFDGGGRDFGRMGGPGGPPRKSGGSQRRKRQKRIL